MTPATTEQNTLAVIAQLARDPATEVNKLATLLEMQYRFEERAAKVAFNRDFALAAMEMPRVVKDGVKDMGDKGAIPFAKYETLDAAIKPVETRYGFTRSFRSKPIAGGVVMVCVLAHCDGHAEDSEMQLPPDPGPGRNALQAIGSSHSYGRRYLTLNMWNIVTVGADDDGNRGGTAYVSDREVQIMRDLLDQCGMTTPQTRAGFLKVAKVSRLEDITMADAPGLIKQLELKLRKMGGR
jgi:hypothetical protein